MEVELKHTWRARRTAWYIRLYLWVWEGRLEEITFCKIFWAYMFMWLGLPVRCFVAFIGGTKRLVRHVFRGIGRGLRPIGRFLGRIYYAEQQLAPTEPGPPPVYQARQIYPEWMTNDRSAVGEWLAAVVKRSGSQRDQPSDEPSDEPSRGPVMRRLLTGIETGAAWSEMERQKLAWNVLRPIGRGVAYGIGAVLAATICSLQVLLGALRWFARRLEHALPYVGAVVEEAALLVLRISWTLLWPARKVANWIDAYLDTAATLIAIFLAAFIVAAYVACLVVILGETVLHPLVLLIVVVTLFGLVALCLALSFGLAFMLERWLAPTVYVGVVKPITKGTSSATEIIGEGTVSFAKVMLIGYKAVKSNTCPKIELEEEE